MVLRPVGHDLRRAELVAAVDQIDDAGELGQVVGLFDGRIAAADDDQRLVAEAGSAPSHTAHALTPRFLNFSSEGRPR